MNRWDKARTLFRALNRDRAQAQASAQLRSPRQTWARRDGVSAEPINRWRNRLVDAGKAALDDGMPGKAGSAAAWHYGRQAVANHKRKEHLC